MNMRSMTAEERDLLVSILLGLKVDKQEIENFVFQVPMMLDDSILRRDGTLRLGFAHHGFLFSLDIDHARIEGRNARQVFLGVLKRAEPNGGEREVSSEVFMDFDQLLVTMSYEIEKWS